jgi:AcrR family transcriptional regulator
MGANMPTFSNAEREYIRSALLENAHRLFVQRGLKKTSLEELTGAVGIAKSSFYSFFESKEDLYLELLALERPEAEARLLPLLEIRGEPADGIAQFIRETINYIERMPLTRRLITHPEEIRLVARRAKPEHLEAKFQYGTLPIVQAVAGWQAQSLVIDEPPEVIAGILRAVTMLMLHKDDIGSDIYPEVIDLMIRLIAQGLARSGNNPASSSPQEFIAEVAQK